ncbi:MAG: hypothetical protein WBG48_07655 [Pricia sp.]
MFYNLFFAKRIKKEKIKVDALYREIRSLRSQTEKSQETAEFEQKRYSRLKYLLNQRVHKGSSCTIETTGKGYETLVAVSKEGTEFETEIFNLDNTQKMAKRELVLWAKEHQDHYHIRDIQGGSGKGHGSIAMNSLIEHVKNNNNGKWDGAKSYISGNLYTEGEKNRERQDAFYPKWGFAVDRDRMKIRFDL